jgi:four helix bundle protein
VADFRRLEVWKKAHELALKAHSVAVKIRGTTYISLRSQLVRSAMSVPSNIVEGRSQQSEKEFGRFLRYALNSASELEYHLLMAHEIGVVSDADFTALSADATRVRKMLYGLINRLSDPARSH